VSARLDLAAQEEQTKEKIRLLLTAAYGYQWQTPGASSAAEDVARRSQGGHSDPTSEIALDERRLALRGAVAHAERALWLPWLFSLDEALDRLTSALEPYGAV
jgi:hypothetical protein